MPQIDVTVPTEDGTCTATLHTPTGEGPWPGVILYPDAGGFRGTFVEMGERLAGLGYTVLVPNIYYRAGDYPPFDVATVFDDKAEFARLTALAATLTVDLIARDAGAYLTFLLDRPETSGTAAGTTGYCMGGRLSLLTAGYHPDRVAAAASFHGGNLAVAEDPGSPHALAGRIRATVYVAAAENDAFFPPEQSERLERVLTAAGVRHTLETYPAGHGFAVPDNPAYDAAAEERHWAALANLYGAILR